MLAKRHVYCSIEKIGEALPHLTKLELGIEIVFDGTAELWPQTRWENLLREADAIQKAKLPVTIHGPFHGINFGSRDAHVREFSESSMRAAIEACESFQSPLVVFHTGFLPQLAPKSHTKWLASFLPALDRLLEVARKHSVFLAMENTYEEEPDLFHEIFYELPHPYLRMCFDTGHAACFGKVAPERWVNEFVEKICHLHVSDNDGKADLHWPPGRGVIAFNKLIAPLAESANTVSVTYEVAGPEVPAAEEYMNTLMKSISN